MTEDVVATGSAAATAEPDYRETSILASGRVPVRGSSDAEGIEAERTDRDILAETDEAIPDASMTAVDDEELRGDPRTDAQTLCIVLTLADQQAKEAFCRSQWKLDRDRKRECWAKANSNSPLAWRVYCLITLFPD